MIARARWVFQISQGSLETLYSDEAANFFMFLQQIYSRNYLPNFAEITQVL